MDFLKNIGEVTSKKQSFFLINYVSSLDTKPFDSARAEFSKHDFPVILSHINQVCSLKELCYFSDLRLDILILILLGLPSLFGS